MSKQESIYHTWYKDRDFPEAKASNADVVAYIPRAHELERVIDTHNKLCTEIAQLRMANENCISLSLHESRMKLRDEELQQKSKKFEAALNKIGMLSMSGIAYTKEFTEQVEEITREVLNVKKRWPY